MTTQVAHLTNSQLINYYSTREFNESYDIAPNIIAITYGFCLQRVIADLWVPSKYPPTKLVDRKSWYKGGLSKLWAMRGSTVKTSLIIRRQLR